MQWQLHVGFIKSPGEHLMPASYNREICTKLDAVWTLTCHKYNFGKISFLCIRKINSPYHQGPYEPYMLKSDPDTCLFLQWENGPYERLGPCLRRPASTSDPIVCEQECWLCPLPEEGGSSEGQKKQLSYYASPQPMLWVGPPNIYPIYDLQEHKKRLILWSHNHRIFMTLGNSSIPKRSFGQGSVLRVHQKPEALNETNHWLQWTIASKAAGRKGYTTWQPQLLMPPGWMKRWQRGKKGKMNWLFLFCFH